MRSIVWVAGLLGLVLMAAGQAQNYSMPLAFLAGVNRTPPDTLPLQCPDLPPTALPADLQRLETSARCQNTAYGWRVFAEQAEKAGYHRQAGAAYAHESALYRKLGDVQAAEVEETKANANTATVDLYFARPPRETDSDQNYTGARLEPRLGCLLGAFIDRDDRIPSHLADGQRHGDIPTFVRNVGRRHASYYTYLAYGQPFPAEWVREVAMMGSIPQLAWEPSSLAQVRDDGYLESFVQNAAASRCPIFIRFACEMNGDWTPYHDTPERYKRAFRTVYQAFRRAPNVALIWCPNACPQSRIDEYYPGDDFTDWVGVNFYSVPYLDDVRTQPGDRLHPTDMLSYVYRKYAARKPIAIGEYAASHHCDLDRWDRPEFANSRIAELYQSLATEYPRVKLVDWYDCNNMVHGSMGRRANDFLLTDDARVLQTYRDAISPAWFLDGTSWTSPVAFEPVGNDVAVAMPLVLRANVRCWTPHPNVYFRWDGHVVHATSDEGACSLRMDNAAPGRHSLRLTVLDDDSHVVADRQYSIRTY